MEGRIVGGDELEWGSMGAGEMQAPRKESVSSNQTQMMESEGEEDEGMEMN